MGTTPDFDAVLRRSLAAVTVDEPVKANYLVQPAAKAGDFHFLFWGGCPALRTRDPERLVEGLRAHLGGHQEPGLPVRRTHRMNAVLLGDRAVVVPDIRSRLPRLERRLRDHGALVVDRPWTDFDPVAGEVVVNEPRLDVDAKEWARLIGELRPGPSQPRVRPGRYRLVAWVFQGPVSEGRLGPADATLAALQALSSPSRRDGEVLAALSSLFAALPAYGLGYGGDDSLIQAVAGLEKD